MAYGLLKGKRGIIFGALDEQSIAWKVAERAVEEGAEIVLTNAPVALRMGGIQKLADKLNCQVIAADATNLEDLENLLTKSVEILGGPMDFILHSIGMSINVRKKKHYTDTNYNWSINVQRLSYDFKANSLVYPAFTLNRDLHCWRMTVSWYPSSSTYSFFVGVKSNTLSFLKYNYGQNQKTPPSN